MLAAHSIPAKSSGDFKPVQLGDGVSPAAAFSSPQIIKGKDESLLVERRAAFSARLRGARESNGVSLEQIATSTKINVSLLRALESGDLSRWPKGLFRRAYLRDYLRAVGLPVEPTVAEFVGLFPDEEDPRIESAAACEEDERPQLALTLDIDQTGPRDSSRRHVSAALVDAAIVFVASGAAALWVPATFWAVLACVALAYYSGTTAALGRSLGSYWVVDRNRRRWKTAAAVPAAPNALADRLRRLRDLSLPRESGAPRDPARMPWNASLLRIWFLR